jgi:transketolase
VDASGLVDPRESFMDELVRAGADPRVIVLDADVSASTRSWRFRAAYPDRFYHIGIAEQNLIGVAAGLATTGLVPVALTFAIFASLRAAEQVRTTVCYPNLNVKIVGGLAGLSNGKDGATHQALEDIAVFRSFPNMVILTPSDAVMARQIVRASLAHEGPVYLRLEYEPVPIVHSDETGFEIGSAYTLREGDAATVVSCGIALHRALRAAEELAARGVSVEVIDVPTLKPLPIAPLLESARKTGRVVTVEDHSVIGGLGSAVCQAFVEAGLAVPVAVLGVRDVFTESGRNDELRDKYGCGEEAIVDAVMRLVERAVPATALHPAGVGA